MLFHRQKNSTPVLELPQGTFKPSLVPIGQVVLDEKSFEQLLTTMMTMDVDDVDDHGHQVMAIAHMAFGKVS